MNRGGILVVFFIFPSILFGQRGKNGPMVVSSNIEVNEYSSLTASAASGNTSITVTNSTLNSHGRFAENLAPGDLIMIIQMQGASILDGVADSTWGSITAYNNCGLYELKEVLSVPNDTTIDLTCPLINNYTDTGNVQIVRIPRYSSLTINSGGVITADAWNGQTGGIIDIEVLGNTVINGFINADTLGFRGGQLINMPTATHAVYSFATTLQNGGEKGEGIAGYQTGYTIDGGMYCRGAAANAGGGGDAWNCAGGGGGNSGNIAAYNGNGNPDTSITSWIAAWNLEYSGFAANISSGGGRGGYGTGSIGDPLTLPPGNPSWGVWLRLNTGGKGGRPLDYSTGRLFVGGGGGAGHEDNSSGGAGGSGGGLVYLVSYGIISGSGQILSNGENGGSNYATPDGDGSGGAGAGGTIVINSIGNISGITLEANGGVGGSQFIASALENEGGGAGGGGGYIVTTNGVAESVNGGVNGTTNASTMTLFPPDGATKGGVGLIGDSASLANFIIISHNDSICDNTATLNAILSGHVPTGTTIEWYDSITGGTLLGSGGSYTTPVLTTTTVFYVATCPGDYRQADTVFVGTYPIISASSDSVCKGNPSTLTVSGGNGYTWSTGATTSSIHVNDSVTTKYTVTVYGACDTVKDSLTVYVIPLVVPVITGTPTKCVGEKDTLTVYGGSTYLWSNGSTSTVYYTGPINADSTITVTAYNLTGCPHDTTFTINTVPTPKPVITGTSAKCMGEKDTLIVSGGLTYLWSNGSTSTNYYTGPINADSTITVIAYNSFGCSHDTTITIQTFPSPKPVITGTSTKCTGEKDTLTVSGGLTYLWSNGSTSTNYYTGSINADSTITVIAYNSFGCSHDTTITINAVPFPTPLITGTISKCPGEIDTLTVSGGNMYLWSNGSTSNVYYTGPINADSTITVIAYNSFGCSTTKQFTIIEENPAPDVTLKYDSACANMPLSIVATVTGTGPYIYFWSPGGETTDSISVRIDTTTQYTLTVSNGCPSTQTISVSPIIPNLSVCCNTTILLGEDTIIRANGNTTMPYQWNPDVNCLNPPLCDLVEVTPTVTTTYTATITDKYGCQIEKVITIFVDNPCGKLNVPNVFTPTNAGTLGLDNKFYIDATNYGTWSIVIYDRWGNQMFKTTNPTNYWDGNTESGGQAPSGVYYYIINATCQDNIYARDGYLQLIR